MKNACENCARKRYADFNENGGNMELKLDLTCDPKSKQIKRKQIKKTKTRITHAKQK